MREWELLIRFAIGTPLLYVMIGGLVLRTAISWLNRMSGGAAEPPERTPIKDESPFGPVKESPGPVAPPMLPEPATSSEKGATDDALITAEIVAAETRLPEPSLPKAIGIQALSFLCHVAVIALTGVCPLLCVAVVPQPSDLDAVAMSIFIVLTLLSLPVHFLVETWLLMRMLPATFGRACEIVLMEMLVWIIVSLMLLVLVVAVLVASRFTMGQ